MFNTIAYLGNLCLVLLASVETGWQAGTTEGRGTWSFWICFANFAPIPFTSHLAEENRV